MKEWIVDLYPIGKGTPTKIRIFAANQAHAVKIAKEMYPNYHTGSIKLVQN
jgi:hypothetical protein